MAIIIDTNCFAAVFSKSSDNHDEFIHVFDWIIKKNGIIVFGGTKYRKELTKTSKYWVILRYLKDIGKVIQGCDTKIDQYQEKIENKIQDENFDDAHIAAIVAVTKCQIICSLDKKSIKYVTNRKCYPKRFRVPVYYTSHRNKVLLCEDYVHRDLKEHLIQLPQSEITKLLEHF